MKQVLQDYKTGALELAEVPAPTHARPGQVLVQTRASLLSVGTEKYMLELARKSLAGQGPGQAGPRPPGGCQDSGRGQREGLAVSCAKTSGKMKRPYAADSPFKVRLREAARRTLRLFGGRSSRDVEYDFAYRNVVGNGLRILDIGGCDSLLPIVLAKAGHWVTVYDFRPYLERHPNLTVMQGDFLSNNLASGSFDAVILVSTLEHIGLGGYGAPEHPDADFKVMGELRRLLVNGGRAIIKFPFNERESYTPV